MRIVLLIMLLLYIWVGFFDVLRAPYHLVVRRHCFSCLEMLPSTSALIAKGRWTSRPRWCVHRRACLTWPRWRG